MFKAKATHSIFQAGPCDISVTQNLIIRCKFDGITSPYAYQFCVPLPKQAYCPTSSMLLEATGELPRFWLRVVGPRRLGRCLPGHFVGSFLAPLRSHFHIRPLDSTEAGMSCTKDPFDKPWECGTCDGPGARFCNSSDCKSRCVSEEKQCYQADRYKLGCCCDPTLAPDPSTFKCRLGAKERGKCTWECCEAVKYGGQKIFPTICGDGCCKPSNHGAQLQCGSSWPLPLQKQKARRHPCCLLKGVSQDHQNGARCCLHGDGVNCSANQEPCCLLPSTGPTHNKSRSSDPHADCQRNSCAAYIPCATRGVDCSSKKKSVCCLKSLQPSIHDACQVSLQDCSRYVECNDGDQFGVDCSSPGWSVCCLPAGKETGVCRRGDCGAYKTEQSMKLWGGVSTLFVVTMILVVFARSRYRRLLDCYRSLMDRLDRRALLLPTGEVSLVPLVDHPRRVLLAISCQDYLDYAPLGTAHSDGTMLAEECRAMGYDEAPRF